MIFSKEQIKQYLPHREPFLFVDEVSLEDNLLTSSLWLNPSWELFKGHFPDQGIFPGVLQIEHIAQSSLFFSVNKIPSSYDVRLVGVESAKFKKPLFPDQKISSFLKICHQRGSYSQGSFLLIEGEIFLEDILTSSMKILVYIKALVE